MKHLFSCCLTTAAALTLAACSGSSSDSSAAAATGDGGLAPKEFSVNTTLTPPGTMDGVIILHPGEQLAYFTNNPADLSHAYQGHYDYVKTGTNTAKLVMGQMSCESIVSFSPCMVAMELDMVFQNNGTVLVSGNQKLLGTYAANAEHPGTHADTNGTQDISGGANHLDDVLHVQGGSRTLNQLPFTITPLP